MNNNSVLNANVLILAANILKNQTTAEDSICKEIDDIANHIEDIAAQILCINHLQSEPESMIFRWAPRTNRRAT